MLYVYIHVCVSVLKDFPASRAVRTGARSIPIQFESRRASVRYRHPPARVRARKRPISTQLARGKILLASARVLQSNPTAQFPYSARRVSSLGIAVVRTVPVQVAAFAWVISGLRR